MPLLFQSDPNQDNEERVPAASGDIFIPSASTTPNPAPMPLKLTADELRQAVANIHFTNEGDGNERQYWPVLKEHFPNCERFWQELISPMTHRIGPNSQSLNRIARRDGIADDIWNVSYLNYSLFLHLAAAHDHLAMPVVSSFGDFYTHLGSACDLAEDFLLAIHISVCECKGEPVPVLQGLSQDEYLKMAARWYEEEYPMAYEHYHKKGKAKPVFLPPRSTILDGSFASDRQAWKAYDTFASQVRPYRNKMVHNVALGNILISEGHVLVPKKKYIGQYGKLQDVFDAAKDHKRLEKDFVVREEQMMSDFQELQQHLNALWEKPIGDLTKLLYEDKNAALMAKYNLRMT